jgi:hypothetical protein
MQMDMKELPDIECKQQWTFESIHEALRKWVINPVEIKGRLFSFETSS